MKTISSFKKVKKSVDLYISPGLNVEEHEDLVRRYLICFEARDKFLKLEISFNDYLEALFNNGVDVDEFTIGVVSDLNLD